MSTTYPSSLLYWVKCLMEMIMEVVERQEVVRQELVHQDLVVAVRQQLVMAVRQVVVTTGRGLMDEAAKVQREADIQVAASQVEIEGRAVVD